jgi:hypothetical protein
MPKASETALPVAPAGSTLDLPLPRPSAPRPASSPDAAEEGARKTEGDGDRE